MRYAIISDVHGNYAALEAVLRDAYKNFGITPANVFSLGDNIGYGPNPKKCYEKSKEFGINLIGNHEFQVAYKNQVGDFMALHPEAQVMMDFTLNRLSRSNLEDLCSSIPKDDDGLILVDGSYSRKELEDGKIILIHGTPKDSLMGSAEKPGEIKEALEALTYIGFNAHTHVPLVHYQEENDIVTVRPSDYKGESIYNNRRLLLREGSKYLVNVGSVGQPRDGDTRASYVIFDKEEKKIMFRRVRYDQKQTIREYLRLMKENLESKDIRAVKEYLKQMKEKRSYFGIKSVASKFSEENPSNDLFAALMLQMMRLRIGV